MIFISPIKLIFLPNKIYTMNRILFISIFILVAQFVQAQQQIIFNESKPESFLVKYNQSDVKSVPNFIIKNIAEGNNKSLYATKFTFAYNQASQIIKKNTSLEIIVELKDIHFTGDVSYKKISVEDVLFPAKVNFDLKLFNANNQLLKTYEFEDASVDWNTNYLVNIVEKDTFNTTNYRFEIVNKDFIYSKLNQKFFKNKIELIDEYYTLGKQIEYAFHELQSINLDNVDLMYDYQQTIDKNELLIKTINNKDFYNQLQLNIYDPIDLDEHLSELYDFNIQMKQAINEIISHIYEAYFKKGMDFILIGNFSMAEIYFNKSINTNIRFAPAHFQIAKLRYNEKNYDAAVSGLKNIINNMSADPQTIAISIELAEKIENDYIEAGKRYYNNSDYDLALNSLDKAKDICYNVRGVNCSEQIDMIYVDAINAKLNLYLNDADMMIKKGLLSDAENVLQKAKYFYQNNVTYIQSDAGLLSAINSLYGAYVNKANEYLQAKDFNNAITNFEKAKQLCITNSSLNCNDNVNSGILAAKNGIYESKLEEVANLISEKKSNLAANKLSDAENYRQVNSLAISGRYNNVQLNLKQLQYTEKISEGKELYKQNQYENALKKLDEASLIETEFAVKKDSQLPRFIKEIVEVIVAQIINEGEDKVAQNNLSAARQNYVSAQSYISKYQQESNAKLSGLLTSLHEKIFSQECKNYQATFDNQYSEVLKFVEQKKFIDADNAITKTIQISDKYVDCYISTKEVENKRSEILPAITYQKLLKNIQDDIMKGNYNESIEKYKESKTYFYRNEVANFGLSHLSTVDFIKSQNTNFIHNSVEKYTTAKDFESALSLMSELRKRNYSNKWARAIQENLAIELAKKDYIVQGNEDAKQVVLKYTNGDKWFKYFTKAYIKQWKSL